MEILGRRPNSIVIARTLNSVEKFYKSKGDWEQERSHLSFLANIKSQGFNIGCAIPKLITTQASSELRVDNDTYTFSNTMERLHGVPADQEFAKKNTKTWGTNLANVVFNLHTRSQSYVTDWITRFGEEDTLLSHILEDKAAQVLRQDPG